MTAVDPFLIAADIFDPPEVPYYLDPAGWVDAYIDFRGGGLYDYQRQSMNELVQRGRVAKRGPHGLGKTAEDALIVLWFAETRERARRDWKVPTTASNWRQLQQYLWPEIHKWAKRIRWDKLEREPFSPYELLDLHLKLSYGEAFALASNDEAKLEGAHADSLLYIIDEAKIVPDPVWDAIEGAFASSNTKDTEAYAIANSTPGPPAGRFYDIHRRKPGFEDWYTIHVTKEQAIASGAMDAKWARQRKRQWGERSAMYQIRVEGNFAADEENAVIPLAWVEAANDRWLTLKEAGKLDGQMYCSGADIARGGGDLTVQAIRRKPVGGVHPISELIRTDFADLDMTTNVIEPYIMGKGTYTVIDSIGMGAGVADSLRARGRAVVMFNASERTDFRDRSGEVTFVNKRSAAWWNMREMLAPDSIDPVALPPDDFLTGDLCSPRYRRIAGGRIQVESKDDIRKRIGRSTDTGDAVIQAFWPEAPAVLDSATWGNGHKSITGDLLKTGF